MGHDSIPLPACDTYESPYGSQVELLWHSVSYLDDEGEVRPMVIYLDSDNSLRITEHNMFFGTHRKILESFDDQVEFQY